MSRLVAAVSLICLSVVTGCSTPAQPSPSTPIASASQPSGTTTTPVELGTLRATGFGQQDTAVWVTSIVHNNTDRVGQTVTVNFNVLDDKGNILKSASQVEAFSQPQADLVVGTQVSLQPGEKAARIEPTLLIEDKGVFSSEPFPVMPTNSMKITADAYGHTQTTFELTNPLQEPVSSPRIDVVCLDSAQKIIGGGFTFPTLVPAGGKIKVEVSVIVSGTPASCSVYNGAPLNWQGAKGSSGSPTPVASVAAGSAEDAFKTWVEQITPKDWAGQYQNLVTAQKSVISEAQYVACRTKSAMPATTWVKVVSTKDGGTDTIPGTSTSMPSTIVSVQVKMGDVTLPIDAHMYNDAGQWRWAMTDTNLKGCLA